jgi:nuclear protein localization family protein 4
LLEVIIFIILLRFFFLSLLTVQAWVATGTQQYAFLYGRYATDEKIPLGITCQIAAAFTPCCWGAQAEAEVDRADAFAAQFGLRRVGWLWTALGPKKSAGRAENNPLISNEIYYMSKYQHQFPNPCARSETGYFGSKFVSVLAFGTLAYLLSVMGFVCLFVCFFVCSFSCLFVCVVLRCVVL